MICVGCCFAASATTFLFAKGVSIHAVRFSRSDTFRKSVMKLGFFSSKCTCMSTMRSAAPGEAAVPSPKETALLGLPRSKFHQAGMAVAAPAFPRNFLRDTGWLTESLPSKARRACHRNTNAHYRFSANFVICSTVRVAHSTATLFADVDRTRVRKCRQCVLHFYDTSKKGTRQWCSMRLCGNRLKVSTYAARRRAIDRN